MILIRRNFLFIILSIIFQNAETTYAINAIYDIKIFAISSKDSVKYPQSRNLSLSFLKITIIKIYTIIVMTVIRYNFSIFRRNKTIIISIVIIENKI